MSADLRRVRETALFESELARRAKTLERQQNILAHGMRSWSWQFREAVARKRAKMDEMVEITIQSYTP